MHQVGVHRTKTHLSRLLRLASAWEIVIKYARGKLWPPDPPVVYVPEGMRANGVRALPIAQAHALAVVALPPHHRDPFDRLVIAQARIEDLTLVTADPAIERYDVPLIRV